jgi:hypothetical protein
MVRFSLLKWTLISIIVLPTIYLLVAIQYGAILYPYWDHLSEVKWFEAYFDGTLRFFDLFEAQVQARPFFPRVIFLLNGIATDWDIRSEYIFIYLTIYGLLIVHLIFLWKLLHRYSQLYFLVAASILSILICSPVGHHTQYYSLMLLPTLANLLGTAALLIVGMRFRSWPAHVGAAALCWMSTYSISNGLLLGPVIFIAYQMAKARPLRLDRRSLFWLVNTAILWAGYLPGIEMQDGTTTFFRLIFFVLIYLGNSLGSLLWFPVEGQFIPASASAAPALLGAILVAAALATTGPALRDLKSGRPHAAIFFLFSGFAVASGIVTAWGRSDTEYLVPLADSSRYTIYSIYLVIAFVYYFAVRIAEMGNLRTNMPRRFVVLGSALSVFYLLSLITFYRAIPVYQQSRALSDSLAKVYAGRGQPSELDYPVFPRVEFFRDAKFTMYRLGIGPYRGHAIEALQLSKGPFVDGLALTPGMHVVQRFALSRPAINAIALQLYSLGKKPSDYRIDWKIKARAGEKTEGIGEGSISTFNYVEWKKIRLPTSVVPIGATDIELEISVVADRNVSVPVWLPLFRTLDGETLSPVEVHGSPSDKPLVVGIDINYERY